MPLRVDQLTLAPVAALGGLAIALVGLARLVQLVDDAHDLEEPDNLDGEAVPGVALQR